MSAHDWLYREVIGGVQIVSCRRCGKFASFRLVGYKPEPPKTPCETACTAVVGADVAAGVLKVSDLVEFVDSLPEKVVRSTRWTEVRATLAGRPGEWARIDAPGGYPRQRLAALGCEVRQVTVDGERQTFARWPLLGKNLETAARSGEHV